MPFGYLDTRYIDLPAGIDQDYLRGLENRQGVPFPTILRSLDTRLGALNGGLDPVIASLVSPTTEVSVIDENPQKFDIDERSEYTIPRPQFAEPGQGYMLPIRGYDHSLGFTEDMLMDMTLATIERQYDSTMNSWRALHRQLVMRRLTADAEVLVAKRISATSPGFAGSGTGTNVFKRPFANGAPLPGGYTHYLAVDASTLDLTLKAAIAILARWHKPPYDLIGPQDQIEAVMAIAGQFVEVGSALIRPSPNDSQALVDPQAYLGVYRKVVRVRPWIDDWTEPVLTLYKTYGNLDPRNPLKWRYDDKKGRGAYIRSRSLSPLSDAIIMQDLGIGVGDRTGAVLIENGSAPYNAPTSI